jgi:hypothetical protein
MKLYICKISDNEAADNEIELSSIKFTTSVNSEGVLETLTSSISTQLTPSRRYLVKPLMVYITMSDHSCVDKMRHFKNASMEE